MGSCLPSRVGTEQPAPRLPCSFLRPYIPSAGLLGSRPPPQAPSEPSHQGCPASGAGGWQQSHWRGMQDCDALRRAPALPVLPEGGAGRGQSLPQGPGLLCSISSSESVTCRSLSYRLGGDFWSSVLGKEQRGAGQGAGRRAWPPLGDSPCGEGARNALRGGLREQGLASTGVAVPC